jgi:hypothetical protein
MSIRSVLLGGLLVATLPAATASRTSPPRTVSDVGTGRVSGPTWRTLPRVQARRRPRRGAQGSRHHRDRVLALRDPSRPEVRQCNARQVSLTTAGMSAPCGAARLHRRRQVQVELRDLSSRLTERAVSAGEPGQRPGVDSTQRKRRTQAMTLAVQDARLNMRRWRRRRSRVSGAHDQRVGAAPVMPMYRSNGDADAAAALRRREGAMSRVR